MWTSKRSWTRCRCGAGDGGDAPFALRLLLRNTNREKRLNDERYQQYADKDGRPKVSKHQVICFRRVFDSQL